jgi:carboxymethylenebutenolidase
MGEMVEFRSNGGTCNGYLATPPSGTGPGIIVIQEYWGLVPHIMDVADRFAADGFVALAPDLYHGEQAVEPDGAGKLMMALNVEQAGKDLSGAVEVVRERSGRAGLGVVGYCMGGGLALVLACQRPDAVKAVAPYYGVIAWESTQPDYSKLTAEVSGHYAELDDYFPPAAVHDLEAKLHALGKTATFTIHPGTHHAFFNDTRPEVYDAAASAQAWSDTLELFRRTL